MKNILNLGIRFALIGSTWGGLSLTALLATAAPDPVRGTAYSQELLDRANLLLKSAPALISQNRDLVGDFRTRTESLHALAGSIENSQSALPMECVSRMAFRRFYEFDRKYLLRSLGAKEEYFSALYGPEIQALREARVGFLRTGLEQLQADLGQLGFDLYARGWNPGSQVIPELLAKAVDAPHSAEKMSEFTREIENFTYNLLDRAIACPDLRF